MASVATLLTTHPCVSRHLRVNTLRLRQNGCHLTDNFFKCIFVNENIWIATKISLKFVSISLLVWIMAWHWTGDKPLYEPMMFSLQMHICVTWLQWINLLRLSDTFMLQYTRPSLVQIMTCFECSVKPLSEPMLTYCQLDHEVRFKFSM